MVIENLNVGGSITPAGSMSQQINKNIGGALTPAGVVVKLLSKVFVGAATPAGIVVKTARSVLSGAFTPSGEPTPSLTAGDGVVNETVRVNAYFNRTIRHRVDQEE